MWRLHSSFVALSSVKLGPRAINIPSTEPSTQFETYRVPTDTARPPRGR